MPEIKEENLFNTKKNAFTIVEVLVAIFILSMITIISIGGFAFKKKSIALEKDSQELLSNLRKSQISAISGISLENEILPSGYGLYLNATSSSYLLFADLDGNKIYSTLTEKIKEEIFSPRVEIKSIDLNGKSVNNLYIDFQIPKANISLKESLSTTEEANAIIILKHSGLSSEKKIEINAISGKIEMISNK